MPVKIQFRRGTAAQWTSANPTLLAGELGLETDTSKYKIGDGTTAWSTLSYSSFPSNALDVTTINAKGDLLVGTANDTVSRLAVGTNGYLLSANSSATTGLEWVANTAASTGKAIAMAMVFS